MQHLSDTELLDLVAQGQESALQELVQRHTGWLLLRLRRRTADDALAQEALHDAFLAVWRKAGSYRGAGYVAAGLGGVANRQLISGLRKKAPPTPVSARTLSALSPTVRSAEDELLVAVEHGSVGDALRSLSPELRQVLQVTVIDGLSTREAAALLGIPQGTVKSRMRIARSRLREQLLLGEGW